MTSPILFCGGEDLDFTASGATIGIGGVNPFGPGIWVDAITAHYRVLYSRHSLDIETANNTDLFKLTSPVFAEQVGMWFSARVYCRAFGDANGLNSYPIRFLDVDGNILLQLRNNSRDASGCNGPYTIEKGDGTVLGTWTPNTGFGNDPSTPDKLDIQILYATIGYVNMYVNGVLVGATGNVDVTTPGSLSITQFVLSNVSSNSGANNAFQTAWSEVIVSYLDTRQMSLVTQHASHAGQTDAWTFGNFANVSGTLVNQSTPDFSGTNNQLEQYQTSPAMPGGNFAVVSLVQHGQIQKAATGPQNIAFNLRVSGADFTSSTVLHPTTTWALYTTNWDVNPATGKRWTPADLVNGSNTFNLGYKSLA